MRFTFAAAMVAGLASAQTPEQWSDYGARAHACSVEFITGPCWVQYTKIDFASATGTAALDAICASNSNCLPQMKLDFAGIGACIKSALIDLELDAAAYEMLEKSGVYDGLMGKLLDFFCTKNDATERYCADDMLSFNANLVKSLSSTTRNSTYTDAVCTAYGTMGCCVTSLDQGLGGLGITSLCGGNMPPPCLGPGQSATVATGVFSLVNVLFSWYDSMADEKKDNFMIALRKDISSSTGVDIGTITIGDIRTCLHAGCSEGGGMDITFTFRGADDAATAASAASVADFAGSTMTNVAAEVMPEGLIDSNAAVVASARMGAMEVTTKEMVGAGDGAGDGAGNGADSSAAFTVVPEAFGAAVFVFLLL